MGLPPDLHGGAGVDEIARLPKVHGVAQREGPSRPLRVGFHPC
jgi:hypothetical protein